MVMVMYSVCTILSILHAVCTVLYRPILTVYTVLYRPILTVYTVLYRPILTAISLLSFYFNFILNFTEFHLRVSK